MRRWSGRDYLDVQDFDREELVHILETAKDLKLHAKKGVFEPILRNKSMGLLFDQASTRTRISFELGVHQMGGVALYLRPGEMHLGKKESICDTARVMSRNLDGIMIRWNNFGEMKELADYTDIPVINGMSDINHPCQALADVFTMMEKCSLFNQTEDIKEATRDCHVVYTGVWWWIGQEAEEAERRKHCSPYQVTGEVLARCDRNVIFEHCLPALRGLEVTDEVMDGPHSVVYDQAENRLHTEKALMALLIP